MASNCGAAFHRRLDAAQARCVVDDLDPLTDSSGPFGASHGLERDHGAPAGHELGGVGVGRMRFETRIAHRRDIVAGVEALGEFHCIGLGPFHAQRHRACTSDGEERLHRTDRCSVKQTTRVQLVVERVVGGDQQPSEQVRVATDELGGRVHDDVGAKIEGTLAERRAERAVDGDDRAVLARGTADCGQVSDRHERVGGRFEPEQVSRSGGLDPRLGVGQVDAHDVPATLGFGFFGQPFDAVVRVERHRERCACGKPVQHRSRGAHARRERQGPAAFETAEQRLERFGSLGAFGSAVVTIGRQVVVRRQLRRHVERLPRGPGATTRD